MNFETASGMVTVLRSNFPVSWLVGCLAFLFSSVSLGQAQVNKRFELSSLYEQVLQKPVNQKISQLPVLIRQWEQNNLSPDSTYVKVHLDLAKTLSDNQHRSEAIPLLKKVIALYQKKTPALKLEDLAKTYHRLGVCYKDDGNFDMAHKTLERGIQIGRSMSYTRWLSYMHSTLAFQLYQSGDYEQALKQSEEAIRIGEIVKSDRAVANGLFEKAKALSELGRIKETRPDLERAILLAEKNDELVYDLSRYYVTLAYVCKAESNPDEGISYFKKAITLNRRLNDSLGIAMNSTDMGYFLYDLERYDAASIVLKEALEFSQSPYITARALDNLGAVYWKKKQPLQALTAYQQGLHSIIRDFNKVALDSLPSGSAIRASAYKEYVLTLIQDKADTWLDYAKATNSHQRLEYALATYKVADQMIDFMRWEHIGNLSKLYWRGKTRGLYERAIETCYLLQDTVQAFRFFEKSRAVMLADKLNELGARQKLAQNQVDKENELRKAVNDQQAQLAGMSSNSDSYKSARMELFAKQERLDAFLKQLEISNPAYYRYKYDTTITAMTDLRSRLNTQKASFVTYFVGDSALYVLGITPAGTRLLRQPVSGYQQAMSDFMSLLWKPEAMNRKSNFDKFLKSGHGLYQRLLASLNLPAGRVIVSPDGSFVPFETLSRKVGTPDYLVKDYAFSYTYSARSLLKKNAVNPAKYSFNQLDFLGVAPVDFAPSLKQVMLPGSDTAMSSIARRFNSSKLLTHGYATRREFLTKAADARVIHLFTHATADSSDQDEPKLYFADSTLQLSELSDRTLPNTQLVVLAACKTGIGANQRGEGVFSLARGFAALGVPSVLTTLWSVQNDATYQLTNLFYKHLDEGLPKDIALQLAKKEWIETADGVNRLPNYWAGLIIVGDAEPLPRLYLALWGSFLLLLLVAAGVIFWYERKKGRIKRAVSFPQPA